MNRLGLFFVRATLGRDAPPGSSAWPLSTFGWLLHYSRKVGQPDETLLREAVT